MSRSRNKRNVGTLKQQQCSALDADLIMCNPMSLEIYSLTCRPPMSTASASTSSDTAGCPPVVLSDVMIRFTLVSISERCSHRGSANMQNII